MKKIVLGIIISLSFACHQKSTEKIIPIDSSFKVEEHKGDKIRVLNFGSAHLSFTSDAYSSMINLEDSKEKADLDKMVRKIAEFKPTVILLELEPKNNDYIQETFSKYKIDQNERLNYSEEVNLIGLEVARLSGAERIYGIDSQIGFDYPSLVSLANRKEADSLFVVDMMASYKEVNTLKLKEQFREINTTEYKMRTFDFYNFLATQHTEGNYEGAAVIARFYERNLRMYSNLNDLKLSKNDRVFILAGATHTAYLDIFIGNSEKFVLEDPSKYTNF
ncbi:DUF5694 domain-containing protein [Arenibacter latericius]|uniref:DUF5694 domain-containing protein n=1 Tax=Arenibacter latericius TaxID=86104 RepID=UPI00040CC056|nr:DUF5694 domain-containing protein [Arenibacter latericius]MDX1365544.1 DUF5694 domain-containing protein [Arenibacter latericius]